METRNAFEEGLKAEAHRLAMERFGEQEIAAGSVFDAALEDTMEILRGWHDIRELMERTGAGGIGGGAPVLPEFQHGGIIPGPIGVPRLVVAHGGEEFMPVGGRSLQTAGSPTGVNVHIEMQNATLVGGPHGMREFARIVREEMEQATRTQVRISGFEARLG